jgi:hypothetical protein
MRKTWMHTPGERVFAIASGKNGVLDVYGAGVYEGDFPYGDITSTDLMSPEAQSKHNLHVLDHGGTLCNPRIRLDSGKYVWGCECWWGPEAALRKEYEGYELRERDIDQHRRESGGGGVPSMIVVEPPPKEEP